MSELTPQQSDPLPYEAMAKSERLKLLWRYIAVIGATWFVFALFYLLRGFPNAVLICLVESVAFMVLYFFRSTFQNSRSVVCHFFLALCLVGLLSVTIADNYAHREAIYFFPIGIFLASQLLGMSGALVWSIAVCMSIAFRFSDFCTVDQQEVFVSHFDSLVNILTFSVAIFFICHQAESLFMQRTYQLQQLTDHLRKQSKRNHQLAVTDSLTGLSNRYGLDSICREQIEKSIESGKDLAMVVLDLDKFKEVNDTLGHYVGDKFLQQVGLRLQSLLPPGAFVGRLGGDEFCMLVPEVGSKEKAMELARKLHVELCKPYEVGDVPMNLGASVGVSLCPSQTSDSVELLTFADTAMYNAKFSGLDCLLYEPEMTAELRRSRELREQLSTGLQNEEFYLLYQPQIDLESGKAFGCEALIRWRHDGAEVLPSQFITELESSELIIPVGQWVIDDACRQLSLWQQSGHRYTISINLSAIQFSHSDFINEVRESITRHGVNPELLDFEITESVLIENVQEAIDRLNQLKQIGCTVSIDDFGTGYSSLAYLKRFPIDRLKIDREFVKDYPERDDGVVASSVVALAKALNLRVLAEGVETQQQLEFLKNCGCEEFQGYYCSRPVSAECCEQILSEFSVTGQQIQVCRETKV